MKINKIFFLLGLAILFLFPSLSYAQAKPKRDVSKDITNKKPVTKATGGKQISVQKNIKSNSAPQKKQNSKITYRKKHNTKIKPKLATYLTASIENNILYPYGGHEVIKINTDGKSWRIQHVPSWCEIIYNPDGKSCILKYSANTDHNNREEFINIESDNKIKRIEFSQLGLPINIWYSIESITLNHNYNKDAGIKKLYITGDITIENAKNIECEVVASIKDICNNNIIAAYDSYFLDSKKYEEIIAVQKLKPSTDEKQTFRIKIDIPNDVMLLPDKKNYLTCNLRLRCKETEEYVHGQTTELKFIAVRKAKGIETKSLSDDEYNKIYNKKKNETAKSENITNEPLSTEERSSSITSLDTPQQEIDDFCYDEVNIAPSFSGGTTKMVEWLYQNSKLPNLVSDNPRYNEFTVQVVVKKDGTISNPQLIYSLNPKAGAEIIRVMPLMPKWKPGKVNGIGDVKCRYRFKIKLSNDI